MRIVGSEEVMVVLKAGTGTENWLWIMWHGFKMNLYNT